MTRDSARRAPPTCLEQLVVKTIATVQLQFVGDFVGTATWFRVLHILALLALMVSRVGSLVATAHAVASYAF